MVLQSVLNRLQQQHSGRELMMRRRAVNLLLATAASQLDCAHSSDVVCTGVERIQKSRHLAILWASRRARANDAIVLADRVPLPADTGKVCVAPNAQVIAWAPHVDFPFPASHDTPLVSVRSTNGDTKRFMSRHVYAMDFGVSDQGRLLAILATVGPRAEQRLALFGGSPQEPEKDLTSLVAGLPLSEVVTLGMSGSAHRAVIGTRERFLVIDVPSSTVLLSIDGKTPSLSPAGDQVAYVGRDLGLTILDITSRKSVSMLKWVRVQGVGAWSPDGRYVLLGAFTSVVLEKKLAAMDTSSGDLCELAFLPEGDNGNRSAWVARSFL